MASFKCKDIGMTCGFEVKDDSEKELMDIVAMHARETHNITEIPADLKEKIQKAVKS